MFIDGDAGGIAYLANGGGIDTLWFPPTGVLAEPRNPYTVITVIEIIFLPGGYAVTVLVERELR